MEDEDEEEDVSSYWMSLRNRDFSGNWNTKQQIDLCEQLGLGGAMDRTVVTQTTERMDPNTVWYYRGPSAVGRIECHNVQTFCTLMFSDNYTDRGGINEKYSYED